MATRGDSGGAEADQGGGIGHGPDDAGAGRAGFLHGSQGDTGGNGDEQVVGGQRGADFFQDGGDILGFDGQEDGAGPTCQLPVIGRGQHIEFLDQGGEGFGVGIKGRDLRRRGHV